MAGYLINKNSFTFIEGVSEKEFTGHQHSASDITSGTLNGARLPDNVAKWTTIWTNSDPTAAFAAQEITIPNLSNYNLFLINMQDGGTVLINMDTYSYTNMTKTVGTPSDSPVLDTYLRKVTFYTLSNTVEFDNCYRFSIAKTSSSIGFTQTISQSTLVPRTILGAKI